MDSPPLKIGSTTKWSRTMLFRQSPATEALKNSLSVDIKLKWNNKQKQVCRDYPLSILLTYSDRAKAELADAAKKTPQGRKIEWIIDVSHYHEDLEIGSFNVLLRWLQTLPASGYRDDYLGKPQIPEHFYKVKDENGVHDMITAHCIRILEAFLELQLSVPINQQFLLRRSIIGMIWNTPLTAKELEMVFSLFEHRDKNLLRHACLCTIKFLHDGWMTPAEVSAFEKIRQSNPNLSSIMHSLEEEEYRNMKARARRAAQNEKEKV
jgi:hypothetical protein